MTTGSNLKVCTALLMGAVCAAMVVVLAARSADAAFPGSNGALAYELSSGTQSTQVYRMSTDGFGKTMLSHTVGKNSEPEWSSDGKKVVFTNHNKEGVPHEIYWMGASGSAEVNLTRTAWYEREPSFFPDYHKIAFSSNRVVKDDWDIWVMTVDNQGVATGEPVRMTSSPSNDSQPAVSPDGKFIAFVRDDPTTGKEHIYVLHTRGPESSENPAIQITSTVSPDGSALKASHVFPDWSPGMDRIVFASNRRGNYDIFTLSFRLSGAIPLPEDKENPAVNLTANSSVDDTMPAFSPDGTKIAFSSQRGGGAGIFNIFKMRSTPCSVGSCAQSAITTSTKSNFLNPSWQPDP